VQHRRRLFAGCLLEVLPQLLLELETGIATKAPGKMVIHFLVLVSVKFVINVLEQSLKCFFAIYGLPVAHILPGPFVALFYGVAIPRSDACCQRDFCSIDRARDSRDLTVPTGISSMPAIA
jgi:hypothetical protein